jgi:molecular chaperone HscB
MLDLHKTHFELFALPQAFTIDMAQLDQSYRKLQSEIHPDRYAAGTVDERRQSLQWATHANEAYQTLKDPLARARYLLALQGIDTQEESNTAMPAEFLMQQMEWREALEESQTACDTHALETLLQDLRREIVSLQQTLGDDLDQRHDYRQAAQAVRKLRFLAKVREQIEQTISSMED